MENLSQERPPSQASKSRRRWYILAGLAVVIVVALGTWSMLPGEAEALLLGINYIEGEAMTYETNMTMEMMGQEFSFLMTYTLEVLDVEDGTYTIRTTFNLMNQTQAPATYSITARINETGQTVEFLDVPPEFQQTMSSFSFMPGNGLYFPMKEARVGDSWQIPIDMQTEQFNFTGSIDNRITETREVTVPAGTYEVFKLEIASSDFRMVYIPPPELGATGPIEMDLTMSGYEYFEKGTCRVVEAKIDQTIEMSMMGQTLSMTMTLDMTLTEHIR